MQDANRLEGATKDAVARQHACKTATTTVDEAIRRLRRNASETEEAAQRMVEAERQMAELRRESAVHAETAGIAAAHGDNPLMTLEAAALAEVTPRAFEVRDPSFALWSVNDANRSRCCGGATRR